MDVPTKPRTPSDDEIPDLLAAQAASGLSMAAFAREQGLSTWKLYPAARKKRGQRPRRRGGVGQAPSFAPVSVISTPQPFELDLGSKGVLRVPAGFDSVDLQRLIEVLRGC